MQYISAAALAFALGASARPQAGYPHYPYHQDCSAEYVTVTAPGSAPPASSAGPKSSSAFYPVGSASGTGYSYPMPTGTGIYPIPSGTGVYPVPSGSSMPVIPTGSPSSSSAVYYSSAAAASSGAASSGAYTYLASGSSSSVLVDAASASSAAAMSTSPATPSGVGSSGGSLPQSSGTSVLSAVQTIAAGETFDCGMKAFDRGVSCTGQEEGGDSDAVFELENGATLSNCIIGPNQIEGVHCFGACTLTNVWWPAVCEDAFTIKEQEDGETTTITGGGAFGAEDKVLQHNGGGSLSVTGFTVDNFGKLYRSCGNCDSMPERHVIMDDITATGGSIIAGINSNYGDTATLSNINISDVGDVCVTYTGNDNGDEPEENGSGPSENCIYSESDVTEI
ncbi:uncharacterized protein LTR77_003689 [Saxophila tyrrhenica]|uniref:Pectate lyase n=1 Tax=Saxophila tyrrhenica TaxID=1690608 RepID=A0AAV9PIK6_9PEZI|nr:hypothetical protein LTR77_003689 [Saxophila tyrrhenica]